MRSERGTRRSQSAHLMVAPIKTKANTALHTKQRSCVRWITASLMQEREACARNTVRMGYAINKDAAQMQWNSILTVCTTVDLWVAGQMHAAIPVVQPVQHRTEGSVYAGHSVAEELQKWKKTKKKMKKTKKSLNSSVSLNAGLTAQRWKGLKCTNGCAQTIQKMVSLKGKERKGILKKKQLVFQHMSDCTFFISTCDSPSPHTRSYGVRIERASAYTRHPDGSTCIVSGLHLSILSQCLMYILHGVTVYYTWHI